MAQDMDMSLFQPDMASHYLQLWIGNTIKCEIIDQVNGHFHCLTVASQPWVCYSSLA
jgi:hypothetical protein